MMVIKKRRNIFFEKCLIGTLQVSRTRVQCEGQGGEGVHKHLIFFLKCSKLKIFWRRRELIVRFFVSWFREIFIKMYVCRYDTVGPTQEDQQMRNLQRTEFVKQIRQKQKNNANRQDTVRCLQKNQITRLHFGQMSFHFIPFDSSFNALQHFFWVQRHTSES